MHRNLKALGLALLAAFALSAVAASGASATEATFSFGSETGHLEGTGGPQKFIVSNGTEDLELTCPSVTIVTETSTFTSASQNQITGAPDYNHPETGSCEGAGFGTDVEFTECHYLFKAATDNNEHATVAIECPEGQEVHIKATLFGSKFNCVTVPPQTMGGENSGDGVHYTNETKEELTHVNVEATFTEAIDYTVSGVCGSHTGEDGDYEGEIPVTAENTLGETVNASHTPAV